MPPKPASSTTTGQTVICVPPVRSRQPVPERSPTLKIRLAGVRRIRHEAEALVRQRYAWRGYQLGGSSGAAGAEASTSAEAVAGGMASNEGPERCTIAAYDGETLVGTLTLTYDSPAGLRSDLLYHAELMQLREGGRKLCEFGRLAASTTASGDEGRPATAILAALFHVAYLHAYQLHGCDDVVVEVNPRHVAFYRRVLGFEVFGPPRLNPRVNATAVLLRCPLSRIGDQLQRARTAVPADDKSRLLFVHGFSAEEEQGILRRLRRL